MKKNLCLIITIIGSLFLGGLISYYIFNKETTITKLPLTIITGMAISM